MWLASRSVQKTLSRRHVHGHPAWLVPGAAPAVLRLPPPPPSMLAQAILSAAARFAQYTRSAAWAEVASSRNDATKRRGQGKNPTAPSEGVHEVDQWGGQIAPVG